jgi:hypothetical protein
MLNLKLTAGLIGLVILLVILLGAALTKLKQTKIEKEQAISFALSREDSLIRTTTKLGQESVKVKVLDMTVNNLRELQEHKDLAFIKQFEALNRRFNNLEQVSSTTFKLAKEFRSALGDTVIIDKTDTTKKILARTFDNKDKWIRVQGTILPDTVLLKTNAEASLQSVVYWQRKKFLGVARMWPAGREWFKETTSPNPYLTITKDELIRVTSRRKLKR